APDVLSSLEERTFFTELLRPEWRALRDNIWPESMADAPSNRFRESEVRAQLLASTARLGHGLIDIYLLTIARLRSLELRGCEADEGDAANLDSRRITEYLARLDDQRSTPLSSRRWRHSTKCPEVLATSGFVPMFTNPAAGQCRL